METILIPSASYGLFVSDTSAKRLQHPSGVPCFLDEKTLLDVVPRCSPVPLAQAWHEAGIAGQPWVLCPADSQGARTLVLNQAFFVFNSERAAADKAAQYNQIGHRGAWVARPLWGYLDDVVSSLVRAAEIFTAAFGVCGSLVTAIGEPAKGARHAS
jgi:hypothetical protein